MRWGPGTRGGGCRAKQTQFARACPPRSDGPIVRNKADLGQPGRHPEGRLCETKPISRRCRVGRGTRGYCTNKPNRPGGYPLFQHSIIPPFQSDAYCAKQSQFPAGLGGTGLGDERRTCETNPISAAGGRSRAGTPNPRRAGRAKRAKRTQFGRPGGKRGVTANKQSQFGAVAWRAKQSQFPAGPGYPSIPLFHHSNVPVRRPVYKQSQFCYLGPVTERRQAAVRNAGTGGNHDQSANDP